jgi:hypothetical protein
MRYVLASAVVLLAVPAAAVPYDCRWAPAHRVEATQLDYQVSLSCGLFGACSAYDKLNRAHAARLRTAIKRCERKRKR